MVTYLSLNKVSYTDFCHNGDGNGIDDLLNHFGVALHPVS